MLDSYRHKGLRAKLVAILREKGITQKRVLEAIGKIPRHLFLDNAFADWAYKDIAFPIDAAQTISQPYTVAYQSSLLEIKKGDLVLEVGTGSGYQACVLSELGAKVYSIERQRALFEKTSKLLVDLNYPQIRTLYGDGYKGAPLFAPFDKIIVTAGAEEVPNTLLEQLAIGGRMVIPVGLDGHQKMLVVTRKSETQFSKQTLGDFKFVPFLKGVSVK